MDNEIIQNNEPAPEEKTENTEKASNGGISRPDGAKRRKKNRQKRLPKTGISPQTSLRQSPRTNRSAATESRASSRSETT